MNKSSKKKSSYGTAFFIRLAVLLGIALIMGGGAWYDKAVLVPGADAKIKQIAKLETNGATDSRKTVADVAGIEPSSIEQIGDFTVHEFRFGRIVPFLEPRVCTVVFNEAGAVVENFTGPLTPSDRDGLEQVNPMQPVQ